jgi:hypothetical protein
MMIRIQVEGLKAKEEKEEKKIRSPFINLQFTGFNPRFDIHNPPVNPSEWVKVVSSRSRRSPR